MKVLIPVLGPDINAPVSPRFGRSINFLVVDTERPQEWQVVSNPYMMMPSGAGIAAAQIALQHGVEAVAAPMLGPNAWMVLASAGIRFIPVPPGIPASQVIEGLKEGRFSEVQAPTFWAQPVASEKEMLERQLKSLEEQMASIKRRLQEIQQQGGK